MDASSKVKFFVYGVAGVVAFWLIVIVIGYAFAAIGGSSGSSGSPPVTTTK